MPSKKVYDIIGIGIGPFNLGLAALCHSIPNLDCLFIDQNEEFNWHAGMMISGSRLQVPFYADLVTLADPCNKFSFLNFLKEKKRMFRFAILENYFIKRTEYNEYCRWVANQLPSLKFNTTCLAVEKENQLYKVKTKFETFYAKKLVLGTGTVPHIPEFISIKNENIFHSADYLYNKDRILNEDSITIVGSGQSAAEIFYDLLQCYEGKLNWFTRSQRFFPMDYSKLTLEMSTPDYIHHFYSIPEKKKRNLLADHDALYKGINFSLISDIYDKLAELDSDKIKLHANCELTKISGDMNLDFQHTELEKSFTHKTSVLILATGYKAPVPKFIKPIESAIQLDRGGSYQANLNYSIDSDNSIFIQNAEASTHGFNASDLSLGPYRNAIILNSILGFEYFGIEKKITFQTFGLPT